MSDNAPALPGAVFDMPPYAAGFELRAAWLIRALMSDLDLTPMQASGIVGNLAYESEELKPGVQEMAPTSGRGGLGWGQWTGPRRTAFERFCSERGLAPSDDQANYLYLLEELGNTYGGHALAQVKKTTTAESATYTFETYYERPGDPQGTRAARINYANRALQAFNDPASLKIPPRRAAPPLRIVPLPGTVPLALPASVPPASTTVPAMSQVGNAATGGAISAVPAQALVSTIVWVLGLQHILVPDNLQTLWLASLVAIGAVIGHSKLTAAAEARIIRDLEA